MAVWFLVSREICADTFDLPMTVVVADDAAGIVVVVAAIVVCLVLLLCIGGGESSGSVESLSDLASALVLVSCDVIVGM